MALVDKFVPNIGKRTNMRHHSTTVAESAQRVTSSRINDSGCQGVVEIAEVLLVVDNRTGAVVSVSVLSTAYLEAVATEGSKVITPLTTLDFECRDFTPAFKCELAKCDLIVDVSVSVVHKFTSWTI